MVWGLKEAERINQGTRGRVNNGVLVNTTFYLPALEFLSWYAPLMKYILKEL